MARFAILQARATSAAQIIARFAVEKSPASFVFEIFYPTISREIYALSGVRTDDDVEITDFQQLRRTYSELGMTGLPRGLLLAYRPLIRKHFPERMNVPSDKRQILRFLSYHTMDYST